MVCRGDDEAVALILLEKLEEGVQHPSNFAHIVAVVAPRADCIKLIEKIHAARLGHRRENRPQLRGRLAEKLRQQAIKQHREQRQFELACKRRRCHRLACPRRTDEQELSTRAEPMLSEPKVLALLDQHALESFAQRLGQHHARQSRVDIACGNEVREVALGLNQRNGLAARRRPFPLAGVVDEVAQLLGELAMATPGLIRRSLQCYCQKLLIITVEMALEKRNELRRGRHVRID